MAEEITQTPEPSVDANNTSATTPAPSSKMVPEKDLLAVKAGMEKAVTERDSIQIELNKFKTDSGTYYSRAIAAEARITSLEEQITGFNNTTVERDKFKQDLDATIVAKDKAEASALEFKKTAILASYSIPITSIENKSLQELILFEDALKAVGAVKGGGNYAVASGGGRTTPETALERASRAIKEAKEKGHVYGGGSSFNKGE